MKTIKIDINGQVLPALLTETQYEQERGLMFHANWPPPIMVWSYGSPRVNNFWMKNTYCPLDIIFCLDGKIKKICEGIPQSTSLVGGILSDCVVELPYGTSSAMKLTSDNLIKII